jgi:hypothetical protein
MFEIHDTCSVCQDRIHLYISVDICLAVGTILADDILYSGEGLIPYIVYILWHI